MPTVTIKVVADHNFIAKFKDPVFWARYKLYVVREITEGALDTIRTYAASLWKHSQGTGLDHAWTTRYDVARSLGFISNKRPYAYWQNVGVRAHKMIYLLEGNAAWYLRDGSKAVTIPLVIDGEKTFRIATARQMTQNPGGPPWFHPGLAAKQFLEKGMDEYVATRLQADYRGLLIRVLNLT